MRPRTERRLPTRHSSSSVAPCRLRQPGTRHVAAPGRRGTIDGITVVGRDGARARVAERRGGARRGHRPDRAQRRRQEHRPSGHPRAHRADLRTRHDRRHRRRPISTRRPGGVKSPGWRSARSWCPGTVKENLDLFGELDDHETACRDAGFDEVLAALTDGPDTCSDAAASGCHSGSANDSGWPARSARRASVLLLDEPTAHLDAATESKVLAAIARSGPRPATPSSSSHTATPCSPSATRSSTWGADHALV